MMDIKNKRLQINIEWERYEQSLKEQKGDHWYREHLTGYDVELAFRAGFKSRSRQQRGSH